MSRDETYFSNPNEFIPERHQQQRLSHPDATSDTNPKYCDPKRLVFGFGRRTCPGEYLADAVLWCAMAHILATFDILPPVNPINGEVLTLNPEFSTGTIRYVFFTTSQNCDSLACQDAQRNSAVDLYPESRCREVSEMVNGIYKDWPAIVGCTTDIKL